MKTATGTRENIRIIEEYTSGGLRVEVLEYENFWGYPMLRWHSRSTLWKNSTSVSDRLLYT